MNKMIQKIEQAQMEGKTIPDFRAGDTIKVMVKVIEGNRQRLQAFEGVVIGKRNRGLNSSFTVRKISYGEGVERVFQTYSPLIDNITVTRYGDVRQAKLYYLRELSGKKARIKEKVQRKKTTAANSNQTTKSKPKTATKKADTKTTATTKPVNNKKPAKKTEKINKEESK